MTHVDIESLQISQNSVGINREDFSFSLDSPHEFPAVFNYNDM